MNRTYTWKKWDTIVLLWPIIIKIPKPVPVYSSHVFPWTPMPLHSITTQMFITEGVFYKKKNYNALFFMIYFWWWKYLKLFMWLPGTQHCRMQLFWQFMSGLMMSTPLRSVPSVTKVHSVTVWKFAVFFLSFYLQWLFHSIRFSLYIHL